MDARGSRCFTVGDISADHDVISWDAYGCVEKHYFIGTLALCKLSRMPAAVVASVRMSIARPFSFVSLCFLQDCIIVRMAVAGALVMAHDLTWHRGAEEATVHV